MAPLLTICIPSLIQRSTLLAKLLESFVRQQRSSEVEILVSIDAGNESISRKRNRLKSAAVGKYIVQFDDDDQSSPQYIPAILSAIEANPDVDAITFRGRQTRIDNKSFFDFDFALNAPDGKLIDGVLWRSPGHLCPIRADILQKVQYNEDLAYLEDIAIIKALKPFLKTTAHAGIPGEILYHYRYNPSKDTWRQKR